jgi:hypothetical protein
MIYLEPKWQVLIVLAFLVTPFFLMLLFAKIDDDEG